MRSTCCIRGGDWGLSVDRELGSRSRYQHSFVRPYDHNTGYFSLRNLFIYDVQAPQHIQVYKIYSHLQNSGLSSQHRAVSRMIEFGDPFFRVHNENARSDILLWSPLGLPKCGCFESGMVERISIIFSAKPAMRQETTVSLPLFVSTCERSTIATLGASRCGRSVVIPPTAP